MPESTIGRTLSSIGLLMTNVAAEQRRRQAQELEEEDRKLRIETMQQQLKAAKLQQKMIEQRAKLEQAGILQGTNPAVPGNIREMMNRPVQGMAQPPGENLRGIGSIQSPSRPFGNVPMERTAPTEAGMRHAPVQVPGIAEGDPGFQIPIQNQQESLQNMMVQEQLKQRMAQQGKFMEPTVLNRDAIQVAGGQTIASNVQPEAPGNITDAQAKADEVKRRVQAGESPEAAFSAVYNPVSTVGTGRTITRIGKDGKPHIFQFSPATGEYDRDLGLDPKALEAGGMSPRQATQAQGEATRFDSSPIVKQYNEVQNKFQSVQSIIENWSGPRDLALVFEFMKALDPTSVVRESEYEAAAKSGNIFAGWAARFNGALRPDGGFLNEGIREEFVNIIGEKHSIITAQYRNLRSETAKQIERISGQPDGESWLKDYEAAFPAAPSGGQGVPVYTLDGKNYVRQPDGTYLPE